MSKNTLFFDVGNVLVFFSHGKMMEKMADIYQTSLQNIQLFIYENKIQDRYELGAITTEDLYTLFCNKFNISPPLALLKNALNTSFTPNREIIPLLKELKTKDNQLIILSNTCEAHFDYLVNTFPFLQDFDDRILSHKVSLKKPDPRIYQLALQKPHNKAFFIDDLEENVKASNEAGLEAIIYPGISPLRETLQKKGFI